MDGDFGRWLDATMENNRIKSRDLARQIGVTDSAVSRWRSGQSKPSVRTATKIADALGVDPLRLIVTTGHLDGSLAGVDPLKPPVPSERRKKAEDAFKAIRGLSAEGRARLMETYDEVTREMEGTRDDQSS